MSAGILETEPSVLVVYPVGVRGTRMERGEDGGGVVGDVVADMMLAAERGFLPSFLRQASLQYSKELEGVAICFSHMALQESNESVDRSTLSE